MNSRDRDRFEDLPILGDLRGLLADRMREVGASTPGPTTRRSGWAVAGLRRVPLALAMAVAVGVVVVGLLALHHRSAGGQHGRPASHGSGNPTGPPPTAPSSAVTGDIDRAQRQAITRDHACSSTTNRGATINRGPPPQTMLSILGVLRRAPLPSDPTNKVLYSIGWDKGAGVYVNAIRRARTVYGRSYWIVPEARTTPFSPIPARCYGEFRATLLDDLRHASRSLRARALQAQRQAFAAQRAEATHRAGLCFIEIGLHVRPHPGAVGFGCTPGIQGTIPGAGSITGTPGGGTIMSGLAPDGVVAVTVRYLASGHSPARTITSQVVNNVYVLKIPPRTAHASFPDQWLIRMAGGKVLSQQELAPLLRARAAGHGGG